MKKINNYFLYLVVMIMVLVVITYVSSVIIRNKEIMYENLDYECITGIKNVFEDSSLISSELKNYISDNMTNDGYCRLFVGYSQSLYNMDLEKWYKISDGSLIEELSKYNKLLSQSANKGWENGMYVYIHDDGTVNVNIENIKSKDITDAKYIGKKFSS